MTDLNRLNKLPDAIIQLIYQYSHNIPNVLDEILFNKIEKEYHKYIHIRNNNFMNGIHNALRRFYGYYSIHERTCVFRHLTNCQCCLRHKTNIPKNIDGEWNIDPYLSSQAYNEDWYDCTCNCRFLRRCVSESVLLRK